MSSGGVLITKICPALILKLFLTFLTPPLSLTMPITSVSSPASFLNADNVMPIAELDSFTSTSNKYPFKSINDEPEAESSLN